MVVKDDYIEFKPPQKEGDKDAGGEDTTGLVGVSRDRCTSVSLAESLLCGRRAPTSHVVRNRGIANTLGRIDGVIRRFPETARIIALL